MEDMQASEETSFVQEDVIALIKEARAPSLPPPRPLLARPSPCASAPRFTDSHAKLVFAQAVDSVLANATYQHLKVPQWTSNTIENVLKRLKDLGKPFKYIGERSATSTVAHTPHPCPRPRRPPTAAPCRPQ